jgi:hypothetical protein
VRNSNIASAGLLSAHALPSFNYEKWRHMTRPSLFYSRNCFPADISDKSVSWVPTFFEGFFDQNISDLKTA